MITPLLLPPHTAALWHTASADPPLRRRLSLPCRRKPSRGEQLKALQWDRSSSVHRRKYEQDFQRHLNVVLDPVVALNSVLPTYQSWVRAGCPPSPGSEVSMEQRGKLETPEKTHTIPTCENPGATPPGIKPKFAKVEGEYSHHYTTVAPWRTYVELRYRGHSNIEMIGFHDENSARQFRVLHIAATAHLMCVAVSSLSLPCSRPQKYKILLAQELRVSVSEEISTTLNIQVLRAHEGDSGWGKRDIPEKTSRPATSSSPIPTCESPGVTRPEIEPGSPSCEASRLTAQPPRPQAGIVILTKLRGSYARPGKKHLQMLSRADEPHGRRQTKYIRFSLPILGEARQLRVRDTRFLPREIAQHTCVCCDRTSRWMDAALHTDRYPCEEVVRLATTSLRPHKAMYVRPACLRDEATGTLFAYRSTHCHSMHVKSEETWASCGTIPTCENPMARPAIEPGSPWWEASVLIAQPPWPPGEGVAPSPLYATPDDAQRGRGRGVAGLVGEPVMQIRRGEVYNKPPVDFCDDEYVDHLREPINNADFLAKLSSEVISNYRRGQHSDDSELGTCPRHRYFDGHPPRRQCLCSCTTCSPPGVTNSADGKCPAVTLQPGPPGVELKSADGRRRDVTLQPGPLCFIPWTENLDGDKVGGCSLELWTAYYSMDLCCGRQLVLQLVPLEAVAQVAPSHRRS
ncbi:hypothetical protein PR048_005569 [Dryococelus australis]|uniref:Uncharacterized protein n=1 Tax=Dryococelus australis TaxID=614101 RepID=A0ABQ9IAP1_9NEOP|nr:hypothetical protein PR048_005569 [Dryococelus australis]